MVYTERAEMAAVQSSAAPLSRHAASAVSTADTTSVAIQKRAIKSYTHVTESHASAVSLLESGEVALYKSDQ